MIQHSPKVFGAVLATAAALTLYYVSFVMEATSYRQIFGNRFDEFDSFFWGIPLLLVLPAAAALAKPALVILQSKSSPLSFMGRLISRTILVSVSLLFSLMIMASALVDPYLESAYSNALLDWRQQYAAAANDLDRATQRVMVSERDRHQQLQAEKAEIWANARRPLVIKMEAELNRCGAQTCIGPRFREAKAELGRIDEQFYMEKAKSEAGYRDRMQAIEIDGHANKADLVVQFDRRKPSIEDLKGSPEAANSFVLGFIEMANSLAPKKLELQHISTALAVLITLTVELVPLVLTGLLVSTLAPSGRQQSKAKPLAMQKSKHRDLKVVAAE